MFKRNATAITAEKEKGGESIQRCFQGHNKPRATPLRNLEAHWEGWDIKTEKWQLWKDEYLEMVPKVRDGTVDSVSGWKEQIQNWENYGRAYFPQYTCTINACRSGIIVKGGEIFRGGSVLSSQKGSTVAPLNGGCTKLHRMTQILQKHGHFLDYIWGEASKHPTATHFLSILARAC